MKLTAIRDITGKIELKSGLHIGAGDMEMKIGGLDNPVIKHPHTNEPYIPGSSLKGKVRSLLELRSGLVAMSDGKPLTLKTLETLKRQEEAGTAAAEQVAECANILKLFGISGAETEQATSLGPTRVSFADCPLDPEWKREAIKLNLPHTEVKSENSINRIKGVAENPRFTERVPSGVRFLFSVSLKILDPEDEPLEELLLMGLKLLEMDALGGSGSRGYGRIRFELDNPELAERFNAISPL